MKGQKIMHRLKPISFVINVPIYNIDVRFSLDQKDKDFSAECYKVGMSKQEYKPFLKMGKKNNMGLCDQTQTGSVIIRIINPILPQRLYAVISHEIFHAAVFILNRAGVVFSMGHSDEAFAYLIDFITEKIYEQLLTAPVKKL